MENQIPPDDNMPEDVEFDLLEGVHANSMLLDAKRLMHLHPELKLHDAIQMIVLSNTLMAKDGPMFLHAIPQLDDSEEE